MNVFASPVRPNPGLPPNAGVPQNNTTTQYQQRPNHATRSVAGPVVRGAQNVFPRGAPLNLPRRVAARTSAASATRGAVVVAGNLPTLPPPPAPMSTNMHATSSTSVAPRKQTTPTLFAASGAAPAAIIAVPQAQTGPDYISVFRGPEDERRYLERIKTQTDWNRHLCHEPGMQAFFEAVYNIWVGTEWQWNGDINTLTLRIINDSMIVFSARNELDNLIRTLALGADPGFINLMKASVLTGAAAKNANDCLEYLLGELKLNISKYDGAGDTALIQAAVSKKEATKETTLDLLIKHGAWLSEVDDDQENILHKLMRCGERRCGHIAIALSIIGKYGDRDIRRGDAKGFDFSLVSKEHHTVLYYCFIKLTVNMENLMRDNRFNYTRQAEFAYIQSVLIPVIQLCKKVRELSGMSYAVTPSYQARVALPAVMEFSIAIYSERNAVDMITALMLIDKPFVDAIYRDCQDNKTNKHAQDFIALYGQAEVQFMQFSFQHVLHETAQTAVPVFPSGRM